MRTPSLVWAVALSMALAACGGVVRPEDMDGATPRPDGTDLRDGGVDGAVLDSGAGRDGAAPVCPPGIDALGVCQGQTIVRCANGAVSMEACAADQRCQPSTGGAPARCASMTTSMVTIRGRVTYSRRPISRTGLGPVQMEALRSVPITLLDASNRTIATGMTDAMGSYALTAPLAEGAMVTLRVTASRSDSTYRFQIENFGGAVYAVSTGPFQVTGSMVTRDMAIAEMANGGAFAIFDTIRDGLDFVRRVLPAQAPMLRVRWERGRTPPGGTSYFVPGRNVIYLLGGPYDIDEYDRPVILHEFGHFIEANFSRTSSPGGSHDGSPTDPRLAWGEGWGTWFGCVANDSSDYIDTNVDGSVRNRTDLANVPLERDNMGDPTQPLTQNVGEYLVAGSLWALSSAGVDRNAQIAKALNVSLRYFTRTPPPDRGVVGVDFVDFLDGYLCVNMGADRSVIERYVVMQRRFPYDFDFTGVCR